MKIIPLLLTALLLVSCATFARDGSREAVLFNPVVSAHSLAVSVMSNGCTQTGHFYLVVTGDVIELRRTEPDLCRAAPQLVRLEFDHDFGGEAYKFKNKVRFSNRVVR